uniref:Uncharacterized protein n=1 Tax=Takifugu rubripes TaxID=31033 RepID=A0A674MUZ4_TAKRU
MTSSGRKLTGFHADLLSRNCRLKEPCKNFCRTRGTTLCSPCWTCEEWKKTILRHHRQKNVTLNWGNCSPPQWRTAYWELAKAYMPRGYSEVKTVEQCDASALLNLINSCDCFLSVDVDYVREVVHHRNKLMHSAEFSAEDEWMTRYRRSLRNLAQQFSHVPEMENAGQQMEKVLNATFSVHVTDGEQSDSASELEVGVELISQWETEFLQERLQELLRAAADGDRDDSETQVQPIGKLHRSSPEQNGSQDVPQLCVMFTGRRALEDAGELPPRQRRSVSDVFRGTPGHQLDGSRGIPRRKRDEEAQNRLVPHGLCCGQSGDL